MKPPAPTSYPSMIKIGIAEIPYRIKFVPGSRGDWLGKCSHKKQTIWLKTGQSDSQLFMTFIHELLHAIEFESGSRVKHKIIYRFEEGLYCFLLNNLKEWGFK